MRVVSPARVLRHRTVGGCSTRGGGVRRAACSLPRVHATATLGDDFLGSPAQSRLDISLEQPPPPRRCLTTTPLSLPDSTSPPTISRHHAPPARLLDQRGQLRPHRLLFWLPSRRPRARRDRRPLVQLGAARPPVLQGRSVQPCGRVQLRAVRSGLCAGAARAHRKLPPSTCPRPQTEAPKPEPLAGSAQAILG